jgi:phosphopantothenoylcysteine decarboxylase/phosphopantothenate--cysteine ligase
MAAAVADFRPAEPAAGKLKKDRGVPQLEVEPTDDVLSGLAGARRPGQVLVGFAAEHGSDAVMLGRGKLERKRLDLVVVNDIARTDIGFDTPENEVTLLALDGRERRIPRAGKTLVAEGVLDEVERLRKARREGDGADREASLSASGL